MNKLFLGLFLYCLLQISCNERKLFAEESKITVIRFDQDLYKYLHEEKTQSELTEEHKEFLDLYGEAVIGIGKSDSAQFFPKLKEFFSNEVLRQLYQDELNTFHDISKLEEELSFGLNFLASSFDSLSVPGIGMHTSGLNQNIVVSGEFLSISADKYLGEDYPLYADYFYDYQRQNMHPGRVVPDILLGLLMSSLPAPSQQASLLDWILYEGKLRYILSLSLPYRSDAELIGYKEIQENWNKANETDIWKKILKEKHLFSTDRLIIDKYINEAPYTAPISDKSPGRIGVWVGYQIIRAYMKGAQDKSLQDLMNDSDSQEILRRSKYKP